MNIQQQEAQDFTYATDAEFDRAEALEEGYARQDEAWILTDRDVWHKNPYYKGPEMPHPEDHDYTDEDGVQEMSDATAVLNFVFGGKAIFTIRSEKTGTRYTYKVSRAKPGPDGYTSSTFFVGLLTGPSNDADYTYIGFFNRNRMLQAGRKGNANHPAFKALSYFVAWAANKGELHPQIKFWHEGRCCMCNRRLTDPESIESGIGPECRKKVGM